jgi:hypothetical protein
MFVEAMADILDESLAAAAELHVRDCRAALKRFVGD